MRTRSSTERGFTLMELIITVAILGILAAVAIPNYSQYVVRSRRAQASSCLQEYTHFMERWYTTNLTYVGANAPFPALGCSTDNNLNTYYTIAPLAGSIAAKAYTLQATPLGSQATADATCGTLSLDQLGTRSISGSGTVGKCF